MENKNNKLVPLPNPDEHQHVPEEHNPTVPLSHLLPIFRQVLMGMMLRCYISGANWNCHSNAVIYRLRSQHLFRQTKV